MLCGPRNCPKTLSTPSATCSYSLATCDLSEIGAIRGMRSLLAILGKRDKLGNLAELRAHHDEDAMLSSVRQHCRVCHVCQVRTEMPIPIPTEDRLAIHDNAMR